MSKYTTEVRYVCESYAGLTHSVGYDKVDEVIKNSFDKIFDKFPIYDENHREELCCKILKHYYTREIGEETVGLWKLRLNTTLNEIMPYYNELYKSCDYDYNPTHNKDIVIDFEGSDRGSSTGSSSAVDKSKNKYLDTPQNGLTDIEQNKYLTNARIIDGETNANSRSEYQNGSNTRQRITGKEGDSTYARMIMEYRQAILNVDKMIIDELNVCFINIF